MGKIRAAAKHLVKASFSSYFYLAVFIGICLFFWFLSGRAVIRNDEMQHLHTAFSSSQGLLPYRDYFDNHMPAYQFLSGIEIRALNIKPSPDFPITMRLLSFPWFVLLLILLLLISRSLLFKDEDKAIAAALLSASLIPLMSIQARPEPIWGALFMLSIYLFSVRAPSFTGFFLLGMINGLNVCFSLKTLAFPVLAEVLSFPLVFAFYPFWTTFASMVAFLIGLLFFPAIFLVYFSNAGRLTEFLNLAVFYSIHNGSGKAAHVGMIIFAILLFSSSTYFLSKRFISRISLRYALFFTTALFSFVVLALYPVRESQTKFPFLTIVYLLLSTVTVKVVWKIFTRVWSRRVVLLFMIFGVIGVRLFSEEPFEVDNAVYKRELGVLLKLQSEYSRTVMDAKGESIFWRRPFFYALETFAIEGIRSKAIKDTVPEDCIREKTAVVFLKYPWRFSSVDLQFFSENYLPICQANTVMVAGKKISGKSFDLPFTLSCRLICQGAVAAVGELDGKKYDGAEIILGAGKHNFKAKQYCPSPIVVFDRAAQTGFLPCGYEEMR